MPVVLRLAQLSHPAWAARGDGVDDADGLRFLRGQPAWRAELGDRALRRESHMVDQGGASPRGLGAESLGVAAKVRHRAMFNGT